MGSYLTLNLIVTLAIIITLHLFVSLRLNKYIAITCVILIILTAVFDSIMIDAKLFAYNPNKIIGFKVGSAPVEDFFYAVIAGIIMPNIWRRLDKK